MAESVCAQVGASGWPPKVDAALRMGGIDDGLAVGGQPRPYTLLDAR
jgi:hypothetical protein